MTVINTKTNIFKSNGNISIYTFYQKCLNYLNFWINGSPEQIEGVQFKEGELGYKIDGYTDQFYVNQNGELIVSGEQSSIDKYSIDSNGDLVSNLDFCDKILFTVSFNEDGGTEVTDQIITDGDLVVQPENPVKIGYNFLGWYSDSGLINEWNFSSNIVLSDTILYSKWEASIVSIDYGLLYNWYAASDARNLASSGWHIPTNTEIITLSTYLDAETNPAILGIISNTVGGYLKETGFTYWNSPNSGADNSTNFNGRGAGSRIETGTFSGINSYLTCWSSTLQDDYLIRFDIGNANANFIRSDGLRFYGKSIRLIKNSTSLTNGQTGTYTGNDGKVYRTICIGTQEWLADNLAETKYRNGDLIPEVTGNSAWAALITGALCAYNNDWNNVITGGN